MAVYVAPRLSDSWGDEAMGEALVDIMEDNWLIIVPQGATPLIIIDLGFYSYQPIINWLIIGLLYQMLIIGYIHGNI